MKAHVRVLYTTTIDIGEVWPEIVKAELLKDDTFNIWEVGDATKVKIESVEVEPVVQS